MTCWSSAAVDEAKDVDVDEDVDEDEDEDETAEADEDGVAATTRTWKRVLGRLFWFKRKPDD